MGRLGSRVCRLADGGGGMGTVLHYVKEGGIVRGREMSGGICPRGEYLGGMSYTKLITLEFSFCAHVCVVAIWLATGLDE